MVQQEQSSSAVQHGVAVSKNIMESVNRLWTPKSNTERPDFNEKSILIAVMGMTGAGKTTFINQITDLDMEIGRGLKPCKITKDIQIATTQIDGHEVHLFDTPGFDDTELKDSDILIKITKYLIGDVRLSGILYLHPMNSHRVGGVAMRNLHMFQSLVGEENMGNANLLTTMWSRVKPEEGQERLDKLVRDYWNVMVAAGAQVKRCNNTAEDGMHIIRSILKTSPPILLKFQSEIQDGLELNETSAGKFVMDQLADMREKHDKEIKELREQLADANMRRESIALIQRGYEEALQK